MNGDYEIKIKGTLDEREVPGRGKQVILRGVIDPASLAGLKIDKYQREAQPITSLNHILKGLAQGNPMPDIELAMRGTKVATTGKSHDIFILRDDVYIVDGLQRVTASKHFMDQNPDQTVHLGATVHFGTDEPWERERFRILNSQRSAVAGNVILRNMRHDNRAVLTLWGLTSDRDFALAKRISWEQNMARSDLITGVVLAKVAAHLHFHLNKGTGTTAIAHLARSLQDVADEIALQAFRENIKTFFALIEECYGIISIQYRSASPHMRQNFLVTLARLLSGHIDFWRGKEGRELYIPLALRKKLATFPINDPSIIHLCGSSGKSRAVLYALLREHLNKGKRQNRLTPRDKTTSEVNPYADETPERETDVMEVAA